MSNVFGTIELVLSDDTKAFLNNLAGALAAKSAAMNAAPVAAPAPGPYSAKVETKTEAAPKKEKKSAPKVEEPVASEETEVDPLEAAPAPAAKEYTLADVTDALKAYAKAHSREKAITMLKKIGGVNNVNNLPKEKFGELISKLV